MAKANNLDNSELSQMRLLAENEAYSLYQPKLSKQELE